MTGCYDVTIVGGGMAGATLACALCHRGYRVAVIEAFQVHDDAQPSFDDRSVALSYGSRRLLEELGFWSNIQPHVSPIKEIRISETKRLGMARMLAKEERVDALGYVIENRVFGRELHQLISHAQRLNEGLKSSNPTAVLDWFAPAKIASIEYVKSATSESTRREAIDVHYTHNGQASTLRTQLLVAADGVKSSTRELLGIDHTVQDYGFSGIACNVQTQLSHQGLAFERFTPTGPLAFLPLLPFESNSRCSVVMTVKHQDVDHWLNVDDAAFIHELQSLFGHRLGRIERVGARSAYPVPLTIANDITAERAVVVGNAAQSLNPVAGQGFNLALRDIAVLVACLQKYAPVSSEGEHPFGAVDAGNLELLAHYKRVRQEDKAGTIRFTDTLIKVFSNDITPLSHLRAGSLMLADTFKPLRNQLVRRGMGLTGPHSIKA